ncbi:hypothetical protein K2173_002708 [Erythroxylum novogranatense]|uniref:Multidrug resistance protein n=1 Tax=Erythroxylum novogranatense TaxID=1862640 RepID=A0AAV8SXS4_9ROSI|nr:hypothetical protein K2173_002708 [Erythroxylum novogranatense]
MGAKGSLFRYTDWVDKLLMFFGVLGSFGDGLMTPLTMYVLSGVINEYGAVSDLSSFTATVNKYTLRLLYVASFVGVSAFIEGVCWTRTAERQTSCIRTEYLKSILRQDVGFFDSESGSSNTFEVISAITSDAFSIQDTIAEKIPNFLAQLTSFLFSIVAAFLLSWRLTVAILPLSILFLIPAVGFGLVMQKLGVKMKEAYGRAGGVAEQAISSIRTVYSYVGELQTLDRFSEALQESMVFGIKQGLVKGLLIGTAAMIYVAWGYQAWVGTVLITQRGEKGGAIFVSGVLVMLGGVSLMQALPNVSFLSEASTAATRIYKKIDQVPIIDSESKKGKILPRVRGEIVFRNVGFSYPSRPNTPILQGFNLKLQASKTVGLVGGSGSGKSTIISLLERFYDPESGNIFLDGHKLNSLQLPWLRSQIGLVNQEPLLFATSVKENILFGKEGASMEFIVNAAKAANAHDFILKLPDGYDTQVGQFGIQLSGGQKQRIAIARALIRDPKILLLDEATSALDAESERIVQEALDKVSVGRTTIIVAHRLSTIQKADLIVVLEAGKVVESGSHYELMQINSGEGGAYKKLVQLQQTATQNEVSLSPKSTTGDNKQYRMQSPGTHKLHVNEISNYQGSPTYSFTPVFSISMTNSPKMNFYDEGSNYSSSNSLHSPPSQWRLLRLNGPEWKRVLLGCIGAASSGIIQPAASYSLGVLVSVYFLNDVSAIKRKGKVFGFIFLGLGVLAFISNVVQHHNFAFMGERLIKRVRMQMLEKLFTFEIGWFDKDENTSAAICSRLATDAQLVRSVIAERISLMIQVVISASIAFLLSLLISWRVAIVIIAIQPFVIASFYSRSVLMKNMSGKAQKAQNEGSQLASEAIFNHRTITAFSSQKKMLSLFVQTMKETKKETVKLSWFTAIVLFSSQFLTTMSSAIGFWYGGKLMSQGLVSSKQLFQVFFLLMSTARAIADAGSMSSDLARGANALRSVFEILDKETEINPDEPQGIKVNKTLRGCIELNEVIFSYPNRPSQMIFTGLTLKIEAGKTVTLVGQSGSGKSTIIGLIERFYEPESGSILIDGRDIRRYNLRDLRSHIALVSQEPALFSGTIRENIAYGKENVREAEIRRAATLANAHEFISSLKDGYDTYCGERGAQLSGGQKQRIALARAILKNPTILLLDEATSALDSVSESLVQEALEKLMVGRTCVVVAHRLSTIQKSDSIAVIKNGKVVEEGSHYDLLRIGRAGAYYSLINVQRGQSNYR